MLEKSLSKFDLVYYVGDIYLILSDKIEVPYYEDGVASLFSLTPLDFTNPKEWEQTFEAYIAYNIIRDKHEIIGHHNIHDKFDLDVTSGFIPFDISTGKLRLILGLLKLAKKCYGSGDESAYDLGEFEKLLNMT